MNKNIWLIDGHAYIFRAFHAFERQQLRAPDGTPTWALYGYLELLLKLLKQADGYAAAVFDAKGPSFRNEIYDLYKANRPEPPEELKVQIPLCIEITKLMGIPVFSMEGFEADDLIATITRQAEQAGYKVTILSSDKDLMQLINQNVKLFDSMRNKTYEAAEVEEKFGVKPAQMGDFLALTGDSADNIPGVKGIGKKTAAKLLAEYENLRNIMENADKIKGKNGEKIRNGKESALLSRKLVELDYNVDIPGFSIPDSLKIQPSDFPRLKEIMLKLGFKTIISKIGNYIDNAEKENEETAGLSENSELDFIKISSISGLKDFKPESKIIVKLIFANEKKNDFNPVAAAISDDKKLYYIPFKTHDLFSTGTDIDDFIDFLENLPDKSKTEFVVFNKKQFETSIAFSAKRLKIENKIKDIHIISYLLNPNLSNHSFDEVVKHEIPEAVLCSEFSGSGKKFKNPAEFEPEILEKCLKNEFSSLKTIENSLFNRLSKDEKLLEIYEDIELPLSGILTEMELYGVLLDRRVLSKISTEFHKEIDEISKKINETAGYELNPNSPKQLAKFLFEELNLPRGRKTKTGYSTDAEVLKILENHHPVVSEINRYRMLTKLLGTYVDAFPKLINPQTGRVHTRYNQAVAATGRLSSSDPNLQNIPIRTPEGRKIREAFTAPEGFSIVSLDYSQIELRVLAHLSGDPTLIKAFAENTDVHALTASEIFGKNRDEITPAERRIAKAVNFGVIYGQSAFGLAKMLGIPRFEASEYIASYFEKYPKVKEYMDKTIEFARTKGYVETMFGRKRQLIFGKGRANKNMERMAMNTPVQGSAADIIKLAMIKCDKLIKSEFPEVKTVLTVHDELVFEVPDNETDAFIPKAAKAMETAVSLSVPLKADAGQGKNWMQAH